MTRRPSWLLPAPADIVFGLTLFSAAALRGWQMINTDGDLGRHLRVGREILAHGLFYTDPFSWTMQGQPFVPYEWLSEILFELSHRWAGFWGVLVLCGLLVGATAWLLLYPLARSLPVAAEYTSRIRWVSDIIRVVGGFLPGFAQTWINGYARSPGQFLALLVLAVVLTFGGRASRSVFPTAWARSGN